MRFDLCRDRLVTVLTVVCLLLVGTMTWALATRSSGDGEQALVLQYWVAPDGDDAASGSHDHPWATVQHAVDESDDSPEPTPTPEISGTAVAVGGLLWRLQSNGWGPVEVDMSNGESPPGDGLPLRIGSSEFDRVLGVHAQSRIVFDVPDGCTFFLADVGLDEEVGVNHLELVVTRGGDGNALDHADWGDAHLDCPAG